MKQGGTGQKTCGFTMVEVLIVLAVTSALLVVAMVMINGRLARTEFAVGSRQIRQEIDKVVSSTSSGYTMNKGNISCTSNGTVPSLSSAAKEVGSNEGCIFIGKIMVLNAATHKESMRVVPLVGNRMFSSGGKLRESADVLEAAPTPLAPSTVDSTLPDQSESIQLPRGFTFVMARVDNAAQYMQIGVGVLSDVGSGQAQHFTTYGVIGTQWTSYGEIDAIIQSRNKYVRYSPLELCFAHQDTKQSVQITFGQNGGTGTSTNVRGGLACGW